VRDLHRQLLASRAWGLGHLDDLAADAATATGVAVETCRAYLGTLDYALGGPELEGLTTFFHRLAQDKLAPAGSLSFITAA
jgi:predicted solute-binding protein